MFVYTRGKLLLLTLLLWGSLGSSSAMAAESAVLREMVPLFGASGDMIVGPGKVEYTIAPGTSREATVMITNRLGYEATFALSVEDVVGSSDPATPVVLLGTDRGPYSLKDYLTFPVSEVTLVHGERVRIPVTISIPEDAEPGGHYGSVLVSVVSDTTSVDVADTAMAPTSVLVSRVGSLYFITVPGDVMTAGALSDFATVGEQQWFSEAAVDFEVLFENTGSVHLNPNGSIAITNIFGDVIDEVTVPAWYAMPDSVRYFEATFTRPQLFGIYEATLELNRGYDGVTDTATTRFVVIPWWFWLSLGGVVALSVLWRIWRRRQRFAAVVPA